jgi:hypothetical protein
MAAQLGRLNSQGQFLARRDGLHQSARALLALFAPLELGLKLLSGRLMDTGVLAIGCIQITHVLLHRLSDVLEGLLTLYLRNVLGCVVDGLELTAIAGEACCPQARQRRAKKDQLSEERWQRFGVIASAISTGLAGGSQFSQKPDALPVAMGFPLQPSAGSAPVGYPEMEHVSLALGSSAGLPVKAA